MCLMSLFFADGGLAASKGRLPFGGQERWLSGAQEFRIGVDGGCRGGGKQVLFLS